jgi:outer membrane protein assembly factor BamB
MDSPMAIFQRFTKSAVVWSWVMNGLRLATGLLVLPLVIAHLSDPDFGMYYVFLSLSALVPIVDFGFSVSIGRAVSYAMGGATELKPQGMAPSENNASPNFTLLWQLHHVTGKLYQSLALGTLLLLGLFGTINVALRVNETSSPTVTWLAWGITLAAAVLEIYMGWWNVFLGSMNQVRVGTQIAVVSLTVRIVLSCALLILGAGLLSVPIASLVASVLLRTWSRRLVLRHLGPPTGELDKMQVKSLLATLWPNSWRIGLQYVSGYLITYANTLVCQAVFGLAASAQYGFSLQLINTCAGMAAVWTVVKWPLIGQYRIKQDHQALQRLLWPRVWLQRLTYWGLALTAILVVPALLRWTHSGKTLLPPVWLFLLALNNFFEMSYSFWGTLISTENRTPFVRPIVISNVVSFSIVLILVHTTQLGLAAFVLTPLIIGCFCNYWRWPLEGARSIGVSWWHFLVRGHRTALLVITLSFALAPKISAAEKYYAATNLWNFHIGSGSQSSPALGRDGTIYVGTWEGYLIALDPDGTARWRFKTGFEIASSPAIGPDETVYVGCRNRRLYAVNKAGHQKWSFKTGGWVDASPAIGADGTIYFGSWDKKFYALKPDGTKQWEFATGGPVESSAAIDTNGVIYFGSHDRNFYTLNPDGSQRWAYGTEGEICSSPAIGAAGELYFASTDGQFYSLNPDGSLRWKLQTGGITRSSPVLGMDGTIYVSVNQTHCAISPDGKLKWQRDFWNAQPGYFGESAAAVLANGNVVFTGGDGLVMTVPGEDAAKEWIWNYWLFGPSYSSPLVADDGTIYVTGTWTELSALKRNIPLAKSPWPMFRGNPQHTGRAAGNP